MVPEIIDLTNSPPSPSRSSNEPITLTSIRQIQFEQVVIPLTAGTNPNLRQTYQQQTTICPILGETYEPSQTGFQQGIQGEGVTILEPIPESNTHLVPHGVSLNEPWTLKEQEQNPESNTYTIPHGAWLNEPWTQKEHELFVMGLNKHGTGQWTKIAEEFLCNKTPQQVQSYADSFFNNLPPPIYPPPSTIPHNFGSRNPTYSAPYPMLKNWNLMVGPSSSYSMPMIVNQSQQLFTPVPTNVPFHVASPHGETSNTNNTTITNTMIYTTIDVEEEIDLELRLGRN